MDAKMELPSQPFYTKWWFWGGIGVVGGAIGAFFAIHKYPHHDFGPYHVHPQQ